MAKELGKLGNKKAKTGNLGDGPSLFSSLWRGKGRRGGVDGTIDGESDGGGGEELEDLELAAEEGSMDPLVVFGSGIMMMILSKLDARSVALARLVSRGWLAVASSDRIWVPKENKDSCRCTGEMEAYFDLASVSGIMVGEVTHTAHIKSSRASKDGCLLAVNHGR